VRQAIAAGKPVGRPRALNPEQKKHLIEMIRSGQKSQGEMARPFWSEPICHQPDDC
jgi:hypothetical protein